MGLNSPGDKELWAVMETSTFIWIVVPVTWVCMFVTILLTVPLRWLDLFASKLYLSQAGWEEGREPRWSWFSPFPAAATFQAWGLWGSPGWGSLAPHALWPFPLAHREGGPFKGHAPLCGIGMKCVDLPQGQGGVGVPWILFPKITWYSQRVPCHIMPVVLGIWPVSPNNHLPYTWTRFMPQIMVFLTFLALQKTSKQATLQKLKSTSTQVYCIFNKCMFG